MLGNKKILIIIGIILLGTILLRIKTNPVVQQSVVITTPTAPIATAPAFESKTASLGAVTVEVTPEKLGINEEQNIFEIKFNTHSVDLDFDFAKIMVLSDNLGNRYQALKWTGERGGHHLKGEIVFPEIRKNAKMVTLKIFQISSPERTFSWEL